jgi:superoxide reductase
MRHLCAGDAQPNAARGRIVKIHTRKVPLADDVTVTLSKEVAHSSTTEHHIRWIQLFFEPDAEKFAYQAGDYEFCAHGESADGADQGPVYTKHSATAWLKIK